MRKCKKRIPPSTKSLYSILILVSCILMSVGYATLNASELKILGDAFVNVPDGILISNATYLTRTNALPSEQATISTYYNKTLSSNVTLEPNDETSQVSIQVTFYNNSNRTYTLNDAIYNQTIAGTYSNTNIEYKIQKQESYLITPKNTLTITVTFKYKEGADLNSNTLSSLIVFEFIEYVAASYNTAGAYTFTAPQSGTYKLEVWGASGGDTVLTTVNDQTKTHANGGNGGYSSGEVQLTAGETLYVVIGGEGKGATAIKQSLEGGYNGGGNVTGHDTWNHYTGSGGGATHIAKMAGLLSELYYNQDQVLLVAGGGGGSRNQSNNDAVASRFGHGGAGGGLNGIVAVSYGGDGTLHTCATCASGQNGSEILFGKGTDATGNAAGGGGWYGGGSGSQRSDISGSLGSGSGGSGYIDGIESGNSIPGNQPIPTYDGKSTMIGNNGDGHAKITLIKSNENPTGINISDAKFTTRTDALASEHITITNYHGNTINNIITLEPNDATSQVSMVVNIQNQTNYTMTFNNLEHNTIDYSNQNITYRYDSQGTKLAPKENMNVTITFNYIENADLTQNTLTLTLLFNYTLTTSGAVINLSESILDAVANSDSLSFNSDELIINEDSSISFIAGETVKSFTNSLEISNLASDFTKGVTIVMDFYTDGYTLTNPPNTYHYQELWTSRKNSGQGTAAWYGDNKVLIDVGGYTTRQTVTLQGAARYLIIVTYGDELNGIMVVNRDTKKIVSTFTNPVNLTLLNQGIQAVNRTIAIGGDKNGANDGYTYQANEHLKFYSFYINNEGLTAETFKDVIKDFGYTDNLDTSLLK